MGKLSAAPVTLGLGTAGAFPAASRASVLWIGLDDGHDALASLSGVVERATEPLGFAPDFREFHPHLTIARSARARPLGSLVSALGDGPLGPVWHAREVLLMESDTRPTGAVYREIAHFRSVHFRSVRVRSRYRCGGNGYRSCPTERISQRVGLLGMGRTSLFAWIEVLPDGTLRPRWRMECRGVDAQSGRAVADDAIDLCLVP